MLKVDREIWQKIPKYLSKSGYYKTKKNTHNFENKFSQLGKPSQEKNTHTHTEIERKI
jgi:hypothetical protein